MQLPSELTPEQSDAIIKVIRLLAAHGRAIRLREQTDKANHPSTEESESASPTLNKESKDALQA